jgi:superfamily I DNA and/or RNA helicase
VKDTGTVILPDIEKDLTKAMGERDIGKLREEKDEDVTESKVRKFLKTQKSQLEYQIKEHTKVKAKKQKSRKPLESQVVLGSKIVCTTLSLSAADKLDMIKPGDFEYLIIDEAC